jgi:hypothetical protein
MKSPFKKSTPQGSGKSDLHMTERKKGFPLETRETNNRKGKLDNHAKSQATQMNSGKSGKGPVTKSDLHSKNAKEVLSFAPGLSENERDTIKYVLSEPLTKAALGSHRNRKSLTRGY